MLSRQSTGFAFAHTLTSRETILNCFTRQSRKFGFTLAEVLITIGIIGVVAAITMPVLITNINERVNSSRQANVAFKVTQAMDKMQALGLLNGSYKSTDEFVDELQKHLKIAKRCNSRNISECWPTEKVTTSDGEVFDVSKAKTGRNLNLKGNISNNVGLVLADGASLILTYNQNSQGVDEAESVVATKKSLPVGFGKSEDFAYTSSSTASIDFVMDVNGKKGPNSETINGKFHDIRSFKLARFGNACADLELPGIGCVVNLRGSYQYVEDGIFPWHDTDYWAGAQKTCSDAGMEVPDLATLKNIYLKKGEYPELPQDGFFWASSEASEARGDMLHFGDGHYEHTWKYNRPYVMCVVN